MSKHSVAILAMAACGSFAHAATTTYSVHELPNAASVGNCSAWTSGLSPTSGLVLGAACSPTDGRSVGAVWSRQGMRRLRAPSAGTEPRAVNDRGQAAGDLVDTDFETNSAVLWRSDGHISKLPPLTVGEPTSAAGISATGDVAGTEFGAGNRWIPVKWHHRVPSVLAMPVGMAGAEPLAMSPNGTIAGRSVDAFYAVQRAVLWSQGSATLVGPDLSTGYAVNDSGQVVGTYWDEVSGSSLPFIATVSGWTSLPVASNLPMGVAMAVDSHGVAVGYSSCGCGAPGTATRWVGGQAQDLNTLLDPASIAAGWVLDSASGIDESGRIAAHGVRNGVWSGVLLVPSGS